MFFFDILTHLLLTVRTLFFGVCEVLVLSRELLCVLALRFAQGISDPPSEVYCFRFRATLKPSPNLQLSLFQIWEIAPKYSAHKICNNRSKVICEMRSRVPLPHRRRFMIRLAVEQGSLTPIFQESDRGPCLNLLKSSGLVTASSLLYRHARLKTSQSGTDFLCVE